MRDPNQKYLSKTIRGYPSCLYKVSSVQLSGQTRPTYEFYDPLNLRMLPPNATQGFSGFETSERARDLHAEMDGIAIFPEDLTAVTVPKDRDGKLPEWMEPLIPLAYWEDSADGRGVTCLALGDVIDDDFPMPEDVCFTQRNEIVALSGERLSNSLPEPVAVPALLTAIGRLWRKSRENTPEIPTPATPDADGAQLGQQDGGPESPPPPKNDPPLPAAAADAEDEAGESNQSPPVDDANGSASDAGTTPWPQPATRTRSDSMIGESTPMYGAWTSGQTTCYRARMHSCVHPPAQRSLRRTQIALSPISRRNRPHQNRSHRYLVLPRHRSDGLEVPKNRLRLHSAARRTSDFLQVAPIETASA